MHLHRRGFLGAALGGAALAARAGALGTPRPAGDPGSDRHLVIVQLVGGNDDLQFVVPHEDDRYHRARPDLRFRAKELRRLDELNGLHPGCKRLVRRFHDGQLAVVRGIGYPDPNLSHFRSQDIWDLGDASEIVRARGWLGRWAHGQRGPREDGVPTLLSTGGPRMPLAFAGAEDQSVYLPVPEPPRLRYAPGGVPRAEAALRERAILALHELEGEGDPFRVGHRAARGTAAALERAGGVRNRSAYPGSSLARSLAFGARLLAAGSGPEVLHVVHDGYDTHANQRQVQGRLLRELDAALDAFLEDLEALGVARRVLVLVVSEFGRRLAQGGRGGGAGTDHGVAGTALVLGHGVRGGLYGGQPRLGELDGDGNVPWSTDFRSVYAALLEDWLASRAEPVLGAGFDGLEVVA